LTPASLLKWDSIKSPAVAVKGTIKANSIKKVIEKQSKKRFIKFTDKIVNAIPPKNPSQDFLGDILGIILFFPNFDPIIYAKESKTQVRTNRIRTGEESNSFSG
jgi:hypothetical protein